MGIKIVCILYIRYINPTRVEDSLSSTLIQLNHQQGHNYKLFSPFF